MSSRRAAKPRAPSGPPNDGGIFHALRDGASWLKNNRVISRGFKNLAGRTSGGFSSFLQKVGDGAGQLGLGRRRRVGRPRGSRMRGRGFLSGILGGGIMDGVANATRRGEEVRAGAPLTRLERFMLGRGRKRRVGRPRGSRQRGRGFFSDVGNWFKGAANTVAKSGLISKVASGLGNFVPGPAGLALKLGGAAAAQAGLGRRRRVGRPRSYRMRGRGFLGDMLKYGQNTKILSKLANTAGEALPGTAGTIARMIGTNASQLGLGRRRRMQRGKGMQMINGMAF